MKPRYFKPANFLRLHLLMEFVVMSLADIAQHTALGHTGLMKVHSIFSIRQCFKSKINSIHIGAASLQCVNQ